MERAVAVLNPNWDPFRIRRGWVNPYPRWFRIAASLQFGTLLVASIIAFAKKQPGEGAVFFVMIGAAWSVVSRMNRHPNKYLWWGAVLFGVFLGIVMILAAVFTHAGS
ncbi:MAG: hypothetical protein ACRDJU_15400 [Actinomycetota bacterium]